MRTRHHPLRYMQELRLPAPERHAAQAERRAEDAIRSERENLYSADRRAARVEAERRQQNLLGGY